MPGHGLSMQTGSVSANACGWPKVDSLAVAEWDEIPPLSKAGVLTRGAWKWPVQV